MSKPDISVINYDTLLECLAAYFGCEWDEVKDQEGRWEWADEDGTQHCTPTQKAMDYILTEKCVWGWVEDKHRVHIWFNDQVSQEELVGALAHELGHARRPYSKDTFKEEEKACKYGSVAATAFAIMTDLTEGRDVKARA